MRLLLATAFCLTLFALNSILCRAALVMWGMEPFHYTAARGLSAAVMLALLCAFHVVRGVPAEVPYGNRHGRKVPGPVLCSSFCT